MRELLGLCGYEAHEIESELPRVRKAFDRLGISGEDIVRGKQRLAMYYNVELKGVRKLLGLYVRELVRITLAKDEGKGKFIHACMAPGFLVLGSALLTHAKEVCPLAPNALFMVVLGCIFGKFVPILEAAERQWLRGGLVSHCGMVKTRLGLFALKLIPKPDLLITSGCLCDTSPKTNDLLQELYGIPTYCSDTVQDRELREYPDATRTIELSAKGIRSLIHRLQEETGFQITDEMLWEVLRVKSRIAAVVSKVHTLVRKSDPMPISPTYRNILRLNFPMSMDGLEGAIGVVNTLYEELQERVDKGVGVVEKGAPRIFAILPDHHSDPRLEHLVKEMGMALVATDSEFSATTGVPIEKMKTPNDPCVTIASQYLQGSLYVCLGGRVSIILEACKQLNVDGVLNHTHVGCRSVAGDALLLKEAITKKLGIPVLLLEWENFDPRVYNDTQYRTKLELFKQMLLTRVA
jgi:benzoyl-CoA reductase/2-hydroxyglutaryl-CoA dehydratase subunit BcrC/BadD/HgdB